MSVAHPATIILTSLPTSILLGIDLLSLTPSTCFDGITSLPPGLHFVFSGASNSLSARTGYFFIVPLEPRSSSEAFLRIWKWSPELEELVPDYGPSLDQWRSHLSKSDHNSDDLSEGLFAYRQVAEPPSDGAASLEHGDWSRLTRHVSAGLLSRLTGSNADGGWVVGTTSCGAQDSEDIPGLERKWDRERELRLLEIDLKRSWRQDAIGEERTKGARDRSWALRSLVGEDANGKEEEGSGDRKGGWGEEILGEFELCFVLVLTLANYSCIQGWRRILELVLTSCEVIKAQETFFVEFLRVLSLQLAHFKDAEGGLFDSNDDDGARLLKDLLKRFQRNLDDVFNDDHGERVKLEMAKIKDWVRDEWDWQLGDVIVRRGMVELEDGEMVELEMDEQKDDERGEYAPLVVDLD